MKKILPLLFSSLLSALLAIFIYKQLEPDTAQSGSESFNTAKYTTLNENEAKLNISDRPNHQLGAAVNRGRLLPATEFTTAAEQVTSTVVNIKSFERSKGFYWLGNSAGGVSSGSGVIVSANGFIVTNNHVIEEGSRYEVTLSDKREFEASLVGSDPSTDLALLKIEEIDLDYIEFGDSDSVRIGEWVLAVGNPFNLESTVTAGIVSAKGRNIDILEGDYSIESFIQTDAAVNPGNSGGALVNTSGELIGINTAIITLSGRYEGYSFAVPSNLVLKVINDLREYGSVQRGILGVGIGELDSRKADRLGLSSVEGIYITRVTPGSGADEAGIRRGDVILRINNAKVRTVPELQEIVARFRPGDNLKIEYFRGGKNYTTNVVLRNQYNTTTLPQRFDSGICKELGFELRDLSIEEINQMGKDGVYVISIYKNSVIESTSMDPGYIITHINNKRIYNAEELIEEVESATGEVFLEGFYENFEGEYYYQFKK